MKRRDVERRLRELGYSLLTGGQRGGSHDKWQNRSGKRRLTVPRHREVNELTAKTIIKDAMKYKDI